jgi:mono/diheme cytochrome c family protein
MNRTIGFLIAALVLTTLPASAQEKMAVLEEGKKLYDAKCAVCHSHRYIEMQPRRGRDYYEKFWPAEITKMVNAYGAPEMTQDEIKKLAEYLTHLKAGD